MPRNYSPETRALLRSDIIEAGALLDLFCSGQSLHCSTLYTDLTYDVGDGVSRAYEPMSDRWAIPEDGVSMGPDASPEALTIAFDASRANDDSDFVGRFLDRTDWHRRQARLSIVAFAANAGRVTPVAVLRQWFGEMDTRERQAVDGATPQLRLTLESGSFRYLGRNPQLRTDESQQRMFPGDAIFRDWPALIGKELPWGRGWLPTGAGSDHITTRPNPNEKEK